MNKVKIIVFSEPKLLPLMPLFPITPAKGAMIFFEDNFVNTALILALRKLKTGRKQQELREGNLNFSKLFSDPKNIDFEEN